MQYCLVCTFSWKEETPYKDNKFYYSDCVVLLQAVENKHSETYKIEGLANMCEARSYFYYVNYTELIKSQCLYIFILDNTL